jgi:hypothetical protein
MPRLTRSNKSNGDTVKAAADAAALAAAAEATAKRATEEAEAKAKAEADAISADLAARNKPVPSGGALRARVDNIAETLEAHPEFNEQMEATLEANITKARGPCAYLLMLEEYLSDDQLDSLPIPGSTQRTHPQNPDQYQDEVGGQKVRSSYYRDLVRRMPVGRAEQAILDSCAKFMVNDPTCPDEYKAMNKKEIVDKKKQAEKEISNLATALRKAVELRNQMIAISENMPNVTCEIMFDKDKDGNEYLRAGPNCILLADKTNPADGEYVNADTILGFRVNYAKTQVKPGVVTEYKALKFSGGKQTPAPTGSGANGATPNSGQTPRIQTMAKAIEYIQELGAFFKNPDNHKLVVRQFSKEDSDAFVITYGDLLDDMTAQFSGPTEERYKRLNIAAQDARNKRDAEKVKEGATK